MANYCDSCGCQITGDGVRSTERRESGHSSSVSRTGLFNFNLNQMRFSKRKYYRNITVYYCRPCWESKRKIESISLILAVILVVGFFIYFFYFSGTGNSGSTQIETSKVQSHQENIPLTSDEQLKEIKLNIPKFSDFLNNYIRNTQGIVEIGSKIKSTQLDDSMLSDVQVLLLDCRAIENNLSIISVRTNELVNAKESFKNAMKIQCGLFVNLSEILQNRNAQEFQLRIEEFNKNVATQYKEIERYIRECGNYLSSANERIN